MEAKILEAKEEFNGILEFVLTEATGSEIHEVERKMFRRLLRLGRSLLEVFLRSAGTGKEGPVIELPDGSILRYRRERVRRYLSIFGRVAIKRAYYLGDDGKGVFPLDAKLNLPRRLYSYVLQQWIVLFLHKLPKLLNNTIYHCTSSCAVLPCYIDYCFSGR